MNNEKTPEKDKFILTNDRIQALTDGVFAIAMTLMVLSIDLPKPLNEFDPSLLGKYLISLRPDFFHYAMSFVLLALFWVDHHQQFYYIKRINRKILWINIFNLLFVALLPFSISLIGDYPDQTVAAVFFISNLLMISFFLSWNWSTATSHPDLVKPILDKGIIHREKRHRLIFIIISLVCLVLAFVIPEWSTIPYVFSFIFHFFIKNKSSKNLKHIE